jgi:tyrosinase
MLDFQPSANTTVDDWIDISPLGPRIQIKDVMNTLGGPFCYIYL